MTNAFLWARLQLLQPLFQLCWSNVHTNMCFLNFKSYKYILVDPTNDELLNEYNTGILI